LECDEGGLSRGGDEQPRRGGRRLHLSLLLSDKGSRERRRPMRTARAIPIVRHGARRNGQVRRQGDRPSSDRPENESDRAVVGSDALETRR
jgi:hypothetical protein